MPETGTVERIHTIHSQEDQLEGPSLDGKMMSGMIWRRWRLWSGQNKCRTTLNGRILSRRPRLYQNCSAIEEEGYSGGRASGPLNWVLAGKRERSTSGTAEHHLRWCLTLLGCDAACVSSCLLTFRDPIWVPSWGSSRRRRPWKMGSIGRPETSVNYLYTLRYISEQRELQLHRNHSMPALLGTAFFFIFNFFGGGFGEVSRRGWRNWQHPPVLLVCWTV